MHILLALLLFSSPCRADNTPRGLYDQGKYQEALTALQTAGLKTSADYYNAAGCLYRLGKAGQALAYYKKADTLAPGDPDIRHNLALTEDALDKVGGLARDQSFWSGRVVPFTRRVPEEATDILLAVTTAAFAAYAYSCRRKAMQFRRALVQPAFLLLLGLWFLSGAAATTTALAHRASLAAVVADVAVARSGPKETFTELFKLPAGSEVELAGPSREGWLQVRFSLGNVGWIMEKDLLAL